MEYFPEVLILCFIGGIVGIDTAAAWQLMISQPVVTCPVIGLIFGQPEIGILLGILLELPWLIEMPIGAKHGLSGNLGAVVATGIAIYLNSHKCNTENIIIIISILYSLLVSRAGSYLLIVKRKLNSKLTYLADDAAARGDISLISRFHLTGVIYSFTLGFLLVGVGFTIGLFLLPSLCEFIHPDFDNAFGLAKFGLLGLGVGAVAILFLTKETKWFIVISFCTSLVIWIFSSIIN